MSLDNLLNQIRNRLDAATPGPWQVKPGEYVSFLGEQFFQVLNLKPDSDGDLTLISSNRTSLENATLIANAPSDLAKLIEIVEVLRDGLIKFENYKTIHIKARSYDEPGNSPGHAHTIPGVWDRDNGSLAGKRCAQCYAWNELEDVLLKADAIAAGKGDEK